MKQRIVMIIVSLIVLIIDIRFGINILLNKKYIVDGLSDIKSTSALSSVEEMIKADYTSMYYILLLNLAWLIIFVIATILTARSLAKLRAK